MVVSLVENVEMDQAQDDDQVQDDKGFKHLLLQCKKARGGPFGVVGIGWVGLSGWKGL